MVVSHHLYVSHPLSPQLRYFKGIPYAATTGGENRWKPPQPPAPWTAPFNATELGPGCFQTHHNPDVPKHLSEACLNLNVWTPPASVLSASDPLPIMIFFHGGSFAEGSDQGPFDMYDGSYAASTKPVIVITANYVSTHVLFLDQLSSPNNRIHRFSRLSSPSTHNTASRCTWMACRREAVFGRKLWVSGSTVRTQVGSDQRQGLRWRPVPCHSVGRVGWSHEHRVSRMHAGVCV